MVDHTGAAEPATGMDFEVVDARGAGLIPGTGFLERLYTGMRWAEGPVYFGDHDAVVLSDIPNNRMVRYSDADGASVFRSPSNYSNGNTRDRQGRLISCEHGTRRVTRTEVDGTITTLADSHNGGRLNSPNDVVVRSDGSIWFTDPPYGILTDYEGHKAESEQERNNVFRLEPESGTLEVVIDDMDRPNGLAFSPDESVLYVSDTGHSDAPEGPPNMRAYDVDPAGRATGGRLFAPMRGHISDGFRLDTSGNIWTSAGHGVHCYTPDATLLVRIAVPERVANVAFGGPKRNRLFIAGHTSLYSIILGVNGSLWP